MKLSIKDNNLVSLCWMAEITLTAIVKMNKDDIPKHKAECYADIQNQLRPSLDKIIEINNSFEDQIRKVFGIKYSSKLADTMNAVITFLETRSTHATHTVLREAGIGDTVVLETLGDRL